MNIATLYRYRQLIAALTARDLKARYRGSVLGFFWSLANPLLLLAVYTIVFTKFFPSKVAQPFSLFLFTGILPWAFFSAAILESTNAISGNAGLIKKVMFPAEALPIVVVLSHLVHFALAIPVLLTAKGAFALAAHFGLSTGQTLMRPTILLLPVLMILQTCFVAGLSLAISSVSILFRDLRDIITNLIQLGFFITPIIYTIDSIDSGWMRALLRLNPMTPFVIAYQDVLFYGVLPTLSDTFLMIAYALASLALGFAVFDRLRDTLAEAI